MSGLFYPLEVRLHLLPLDSVSCLVIWHVLKDHILFLQYKNKAQKKATLRVGVLFFKPLEKLEDLIAVLLVVKWQIALGTHSSRNKTLREDTCCCLSCSHFFSPTQFHKWVLKSRLS